MPFGGKQGGLAYPVQRVMRIVNGYCSYADSAVPTVIPIIGRMAQTISTHSPTHNLLVLLVPSSDLAAPAILGSR